FFKDIVQHDAMHQKRRRGAKGNNVGQRVEFASERAVLSAEARHPPVQQVKNAGEDDKEDGVADGWTEGAGIVDVRSDNERQRQKAAKEISRRQQVRQQKNFQLRARAFGPRGVAGLSRHRSSGSGGDHGFAATDFGAELDADFGCQRQVNVHTRAELDQADAYAPRHLVTLRNPRNDAPGQDTRDQAHSDFFAGLLARFKADQHV